MANHLNPLELEAVKKLIKALNGPLELKAWIDHTKKIIQYDEILGNVEIESSLLEGKILDADCKRWADICCDGKTRIMLLEEY